MRCGGGSSQSSSAAEAPGTPRQLTWEGPVFPEHFYSTSAKFLVVSISFCVFVALVMCCRRSKVFLEILANYAVTYTLTLSLRVPGMLEGQVAVRA